MTVGIPPLVRKARAAHEGECTLMEFVHAFQEETVYIQRPEQPGAFVAELDSGERWVSVFSSPERMARFTGSEHWASLSGHDLTSLLPVGVNVLVDPTAPHAVAIESVHLPRPLNPIDT